MIQIKDLGFSYGEKIVLKNITMVLEEGRIYGLLGENGVGKTTLLTLLCGLKKPQKGSINADGHDPYRREPSFLSDQYYLSDEVATMNMKAINYAVNYGKFWENFDLETFQEIMEVFENNPLQKMNRMSFGQLKKTYICFSLATKARYIFMDEPTNALDIPSKAAFRKALLSCTGEESTVVISTHQVRDLENVIDPIVILDRQDVLLNAGLDRIADKLYFDYGNTIKSESLYSEQLPGGFIQVYPNTMKEDSKVNIEALFNAVHKNKETLKALFADE